MGTGDDGEFGVGIDKGGACGYQGGVIGQGVGDRAIDTVHSGGSGNHTEGDLSVGCLLGGGGSATPDLAGEGGTSGCSFHEGDIGYLPAP